MKKNNHSLKTIFLFFLTLSLFTIYITGCGNGKEEMKNVPKVSTQLPTGKFFTLSDVHFNPFYDTSLVAQLVKTNVQGWEAIFQSSQIKNYGAYNYDSNFLLMTGAFAQMATVNAHPDFIVITGDFLGHNFQADYEQYTGISLQDSINSFITKTIQFMAMELEKEFPGIPIYPVLGNNDDFCGDYEIQPNDPFLPMFAQTWSSTLDSTVGINTFSQTFPTGGYYATCLPGYPNHVIIGMNSIFFCPKDVQTCLPGGPDTTSGHPEITWLQQTLDSCAAHNQKVWFTCHIPPGADAYASLEHQGSPADCSENIKMMWKSEYDSAFLAIENQYKTTIVGGLAGHTHMDDFRVVMDPTGNPISFFHINPSISPIDGNNPGFQLFTYDTATMVMQDYTTYVFQGLQFPSNQTWSTEYDFNQTYNVANLSGATMNTVWQNIASDSIMRGHYSLYYGDGSPNSMATPWMPFWCGIGHLDQTSFTDCFCAAGVSEGVIKGNKKGKKK